MVSDHKQPLQATNTDFQQSFGFIDLVGVKHAVPPPTEAMTIQQWLKPWIQIPWENLWFTLGNEVVPANMMVDDTSPVCLRLRFGPRPHVSKDVNKHDGCSLICGYVDLAGRFYTCPTPHLACTVREWVAENAKVDLSNIWFTCDGKALDPEATVKVGCPLIVRMRARLCGGGRESSDTKRLEQLLLLHGVPAAEAVVRAGKVQEAIGKDVLQQVMGSVEPWKQLKRAVGQKVRLVLPTELQQHKRADKPVDPFDSHDPWAEALAGPANDPVDLALDPDYFVDQSDVPLPLIEKLSVGGKGAALVSVLDTEVFARIHGVSSEDEMVAIVIATETPQVGQLICEALTFPAWHKKSKVLVRGFIVQFGKALAKTKPIMQHFSLAADNQTVVSVELRREYCKIWENVSNNPLRHVLDSISGLQGAMKGSWSRRFFRGRAPVESPDTAETWHAFMRVEHSAVEDLIKQSGVGGIFLTPKDSATFTASGLYKVIWLQSAQLEEGMIILKSIQESCGLVRGKTSLGIRVRAENYSSVRTRLEPQWKAQSDLVNIAIEKRWTMTPVPHELDRGAVQDLLQSMGWRATPIKKLNGNTWMIGSGKNDNPASDTVFVGSCLALVSELRVHRPPHNGGTVVAGPPGLRQALDKQLAGSKLSAFSSASSSAPTTVMSASSGPTLALIQDLRHEMSEKIKEIRNEVETAVGTMTNRFEQHQASTAELCAEAKASAEQSLQAVQDVAHQQAQVSSQLAQISQNVITKVDLQAAMAAQSQEIRALLLRAPQEGTPTSDAKAARAAPY